jgi:hypothetical protein
VAVEPVLPKRAANGLYLAADYKAPACYVAQVLEIGAKNAPFKVGDFVVVESQVGHPCMAAVDPKTKKTRVVDLPCSAFGGSEHKQVGIVPFSATGSEVDHEDLESVRRVARINELGQKLEASVKDFADLESAEWVNERKAHAIWLHDYEQRRSTKRRTNSRGRSDEVGKGDGIIAVVDTVDELVGMGIDPDDLATMVARIPR